jgi:hypothetical protein
MRYEILLHRYLFLTHYRAIKQEEEDLLDSETNVYVMELQRFQQPVSALTNVTSGYHALVILSPSLSSSSRFRPGQGGGSTNLLRAAVEYKL